MATVEVYTKAKSDEIYDSTVISGEIDGSNHLILTTRDATEIDAGTFVVPAASTTVSGTVELATDAETITGTDAVRATTPASVAAVLTSALAAFLSGLDLDDLSDVDLTSAANGHTLIRAAGVWGPQAIVTTCTSGTRPGSPYSGQLIYETDTLYMLMHDGSSWRKIYKQNQTAWPHSMDSVLGSVTNTVIGASITGDAASRVILQADGKIVIGDGTGTGDTNIFRNAANELATDDDFYIKTAGKGLRLREGSNARSGLAVLVGGTLVVNNTSISASTRIYLTCNVPGGTPGFLRVSARTNGTSFTILSSSGTDTSSVAWLLIEAV